MHTHVRRSIVAAGLGAVLALAGCGDDGSSSEGTDQNTIEVTFADGDVQPKGDRVTVNADQPITFDVTADEPGEIHVHSSPEQEFAYEAGTHSYDVTIDTPGVVEVESHDLDVVIVQLEVK